MKPETWGKAVAEVVRGFVERKTSPLLQRIAELETRVAALETQVAEVERQKGTTFVGIWEPGAYERHDQVMHKGHYWTCLQATRTLPSSPDWQLTGLRWRHGRQSPVGATVNCQLPRPRQ